MTDNSSNNKRLAKNTIFLYFRMILLMFVGLYASRVLLRTLGVEDYGLYNVVGSIVTMFGFLNSTLSTSTQRFLNIELGKQDTDSVKKVFSCSLLLHLILVAIVLLLAETAGLWYVIEKLVIPPGRETAALFVYQFSVISICIQIIQLPFMSTIIAHERMNVYAYVSIYEGLAKLGILFAIQILPYDNLILYALLLLCVQLSVALIYNIYCQRHFKEARFRVYYEKDLFRSMLGFSGWNIIGNLATVCNSQGLNMVMNAFFGTAINAARGIAFQVHNLVQQLIGNFQLAVKPQVIKYYAAGQMKEMTNLVFNAAKYSAFLVIIATIPLILEIRPALKLWLGDYPEYTVIFAQLILFRSIISSMTGNIVMVVHASGYLKNVGLFSGVILLLVLPISYILLKMGMPPYIPFIINIGAAFGDAFFELYWMKHYIGFPMGRFYKKVYGPVFLLFAIIFALSYGLHYLMADCNEYIRMIVVSAFSVTISVLLIFKFGLSKSMRESVTKKIFSKFKGKK